MFELTSTALSKNLSFAKDRHPAAFEAAALHEAVLAELLPQKREHSRDLLKSYLRRLDLSVDSRLLMDLNLDCDFEIWTPDMRFVGCSHGFMKASSYSFEDLAERNWAELFSRDPIYQQQILAAIMWLLQSPRERTYIPDVTDWHVVAESAAERRAIEIRVKSGGIAYTSSGEPRAIIAITQLRGP